MPEQPRVALLIETSREYGRGLLRGVAAYSRSHGHWSFYHHEHALGDAPPNWLRQCDIDGIIARVESQQLVDEIERLAVPTVDLRGLHRMPDVPQIETNDAMVVRLACEELLGRGFRNIAYCGFAGANYSEKRKALTIKYLAARGKTPLICESPPIPADDTSSIESEGMLQEAQLKKWLSELPTPVGVFACNDSRAQQILNVCRYNSVPVPDEVAVVGVDNDEFICELTDPPLTSIEPATHRIGYEAAEALAQMMSGADAPFTRKLIDPVGVVARRSTDVLAIDDQAVATAVRFIRDHACEGISVADVVQQVPLSRSSLDRRFAETLGRSPKMEILRVRLQHVRRLLVDTDYKLPSIARMTGFLHAEYLCTIFKKQFGDTPGEYRTAQRIDKPW